MLNSAQLSEVRQGIERIVRIACEVEAVPNFGPDVWTMQEMDRKCQMIRGECQAIGSLVGSGDVLHNTNVSQATKVISTDTAAAIQSHLNRIRILADGIEAVPNFGPDIWSMRKIDDECRQIVQHAEHAWQLLNVPGTSHA
jgi:hypothetical protein